MLQLCSSSCCKSPSGHCTEPLAKNLGLSVVAEGIENVEQLDYLRSLRCDQYQGFLFSRPIVASELAALLVKDAQVSRSTLQRTVTLRPACKNTLPGKMRMIIVYSQWATGALFDSVAKLHLNRAGSWIGDAVDEVTGFALRTLARRAAAHSGNIPFSPQHAESLSSARLSCLTVFQGAHMRKIHFAIPLLLLTYLSPAVQAGTDVRVIISGQVAPGVYGRVDYGNDLPPPVLYANPVTIVRQPQPVQVQPIYLHVPPGHARNWGKHCAKYNACGTPVYFVRSAEYEPKKDKKEKKEKKDKHDQD